MDGRDADSSENQHSDNEFEKVQLPGEDELKDDSSKSQGSISQRPGKDGNHRPEAKTSKAMLEAKSSGQEKKPDNKSFWATAIDPRVLDLIYWKDVRKTGAVFACSLLILTLMALFSVLSIISYASLFALTFTFAYRLYGNAVIYFKKSKEPHPLNKYLEKRISLPSEGIHKMADQLVLNVSKVIDDVRKLFLVQRFLDSVKFAILLWFLTFIGSWLDGTSLFIIGDIILFTIPKVYQVYQKQIDEFLASANAKLEALLKAVQEKVQRTRKND